MPFPTNIPIDVGSSGAVDLGVTAMEMEDGSPHNQTHYPSTLDFLTMDVSHQDLLLADYDIVVDYLRANADLEFQLFDPAKNRTWTGRLMSGTLQEEMSSGERITLSWRFRGKRVVCCREAWNDQNDG